MSQSILVTGGAGYVGSHACKALASAGYIPVVYDNLSRGHREAVRWGPLVDGDLRDYIHVSDLADAHVRAVRDLAAGGDSAALNLGTGHGYSVREAIAAVERIGGRKVPQREVARRPGDPPELVADPALALSRLGWQPRHSDLDTIIATALAWETH